MKHTCLVCGFPGLLAAPRAKNGGGSFEICPCCGYQFGVSDDDRHIAPAQWRAQWQRDGMKWASRQPTPKNWDAARQFQEFLKGEK
jgi:hypothetical protein